MRIKRKEEILKMYKVRYPELDKYVLEELSKEYDRFFELLKGCNSKSQAIEVFDNELRKNEQKFKDDENVGFLEGSPHTKYMEIMSRYGVINFFKENMLA